MVSDTFDICKQIKRIRAKKIIDAKKQNPPRYIAFDVFSSMHFHAADIFFDVTQNTDRENNRKNGYYTSRNREIFCMCIAES